MLSKKFALDCLERAAKTFLQTFAAAWATSGATDLDSIEQLAFASIGAALSVLTSAFSAGVGDKSSASALPKEPSA